MSHPKSLFTTLLILLILRPVNTYYYPVIICYLDSFSKIRIRLVRAYNNNQIHIDLCFRKSRKNSDHAHRSSFIVHRLKRRWGGNRIPSTNNRDHFLVILSFFHTYRIMQILCEKKKTLGIPKVRIHQQNNKIPKIVYISCFESMIIVGIDCESSMRLFQLSMRLKFLIFETNKEDRLMYLFLFVYSV